ncbi:MAG: hypothetical protein ACOYOS_16005, partial [Syntrophales bacterium]
MFTTEGFSLSARSAKDNGARDISAGDTADASCTSGPGVEGAKEERRTSTIETTKKPIKKAKRNIMNVLRPLFSVFIIYPHRLKLILFHSAKHFTLYIILINIVVKKILSIFSGNLLYPPALSISAKSSLYCMLYKAGATELPENLGREKWSGRPDSNRRRPAWEADILPLNYA